jgi:hypothetical protein
MANGKASGHRSAFDHPVGRVETGGTSLRWLPTDFDIDDYLDASSKPRIPLTPGRVTFLLSHSQQVRLYDTVDFWRVAAVTPGETLQLSAEMRLTGDAWLEWRITEQDGRRQLEQSAYF